MKKTVKADISLSVDGTATASLMDQLSLVPNVPSFTKKDPTNRRLTLSHLGSVPFQHLSIAHERLAILVKSIPRTLFTFEKFGITHIRGQGYIVALATPARGQDEWTDFVRLLRVQMHKRVAGTNRPLAEFADDRTWIPMVVLGKLDARSQTSAWEARLHTSIIFCARKIALYLKVRDGTESVTYSNPFEI